MLDDVSIRTLHAALNGLSAREKAISNDIANVNTPFYRARTVAFEAGLRQALADGTDPLAATPSVVVSTAPGGLNGNNVNLDQETVDGVRTQMSYELALRATGDRFGLYRAAIRG